MLLLFKTSGQLGLFIGMSILSFVEFIELAISLIIIFLKRQKSIKDKI